MRPARVLFVHQLLGAFGGAERYLELLAPALRDRGVEPSIMLFGTGTRRGSEFATRIRRVFGRSFVATGAATPWALRRAVREVRPDVLHWNLPDPFLYRGGFWAALPWGRPSVLTDHLPMMRDGVHYELMRRFVNRRVAGMIVVSEAAAAAAREHWRRLPPIAAVRNGVEVAGTRVRKPPNSKPVRLLFVGRLEQQKGPTAALATLAALRNRGVPAFLSFVGDGSQKPVLERDVRDRGLSDAVAFEGFTADPTPHLLDAHVLLAPAEFEGLPLAPLEALASGLPVLASDIPPHVELAQICAALRVLPVRAGGDAWATEIERILPQLEELSEEATAAGAVFSVDRMAEETVAAYEGFLS